MENNFLATGNFKSFLKKMTSFQKKDFSRL